MRLVELGSLAVHQDRLHRAATPLLARSASRDGAGRAPRGARRLRRGLPGEDRRPDDRRDPDPGRRTPARALRSGRQGDAGLPRRPRHRRPDSVRARPGTRSATPAQLTAELAKVRAHGVAFDREESLAGFGCVAAPIGDSRRSRRGGVGVRSDEPDDVRPAPRRTRADDGDGHLAQRRGRTTTGGADAAAACGRCAAARPRLQYA